MKFKLTNPYCYISIVADSIYGREISTLPKLRDLNVYRTWKGKKTILDWLVQEENQQECSQRRPKYLDEYLKIMYINSLMPDRPFTKPLCQLVSKAKFLVLPTNH